MPSTYTSNTGIEKPGDGEQSGTWGDTVNDNMDILDRAINGVGSIALSGTTHTLTTSDGVLSDGQYRVLVLGGSPSGTNTITLSPNDAQHLYFVKNNSGQSVVFTQGSGGNVTVTNGKSAIVYADGAGAGAAVVDVTNTFNFQPLTATLTAIGALATTDGNFIVGNGSTWVAEDGATARTSLGLGSIATQAANNVSITGGSITGITDLAVSDGGTGASDAATARTNLGLAIGTNVQAYDAGLQSISGLTTSANKMIYTTASDTYAVTDLTSAGRDLLDDADASAQRTTLGLAIGTDVQAYDADLAAIAGLSSNGMVARTGAGTAAVRTITAGTGISITNGDGASGNPTISVDSGSQMTTANVLSATASASAGAIGTYAWLGRLSNSAAIVEGDTIAGSSLKFNGVTSTNDYGTAAWRNGSNTPSGTWRAMGGTVLDSTNTAKATLFLRIS